MVLGYPLCGSVTRPLDAARRFVYRRPTVKHRLTLAFSERPVRAMLELLLVVVVLASAVYTLVEKVSYTDGLWWAIVTATTVGYGDIAPETVGMRLVAVVVMFTGIVTAAIVTASLAATIVATKLDRANHTQAIDDDFDYVIERVQELKRRHLQDEMGDDRVIDTAQKVIDAHRTGSSEELDRHIAALDGAIHHQEFTDA